KRSVAMPLGITALVMIVAGFACVAAFQSNPETTTVTQRVSAGVARTPTPTPAVREFIPGLTAVDVTGNVERRGLTCEGPTTEPAGVSWFCSDGTFVVSASGASPTRLRAVSAGAVGVDDQTAAAFLGYIATLPYDTSQPEEARA